MKTIYNLEGVTKEYQGRRVLDIDHLEIRQGEVLALVGPSGAGKSTLLRLLNFLEPPTQGRICFNGSEYRAGVEMPIDLRRRVTMVFQRPMLLNRSVQENVRYGLELRGQRSGSPGTQATVAAALQEVGMSELSKQKARTLSGGEAQRVALARAMALRPDVLLLDEPTANLDPYNVSLIERIIDGLNRDHGMTPVLVTHNVFQAKRLAHRVAFFMDGKIIEVSDAATFFNQPKDPRTTAFVRGEMVY